MSFALQPQLSIDRITTIAGITFAFGLGGDRYLESGITPTARKGGSVNDGTTCLLPDTQARSSYDQ